MFIRGEHEEFVLDDWTADCSSIDLQVRAAEIGFIGAGRPFNCRIGYRVESGIAPVGNRTTVKSIRSGLHVQHDNAAGAVPELRVDGILLKRDFLHGVHRGRI